MVYSGSSGLGDELMAAMAVQKASETHPHRHYIFHTRFLQLFKGLGGVHDVVLLQQPPPKNAVALSYRAKQPVSVPAQMASQLGTFPALFSLTLPDRPLNLPTSWPSDGLPVILIQTAASSWTPNKQWPSSHWEALIATLPSGCHILEVGTDSALSRPPSHPRWRSLVGATSLEQYVSCFRNTRLFIGPVSGGMHLAHVFKLPSVIIVGGYEAAHFPYPLALQLGTNLPCAPCWLRSPCPYDRQCLREITPAQVLQAALSLLPQNS